MIVMFNLQLYCSSKAQTELRSQSSKPNAVQIKQENYTTHTDNMGITMFSYYWTVDSIGIITSYRDHRVTLRSPSFYVDRGYRMYIKLFPHQHGGNMYIHVGLTHGEHDETVSWPFALRHQVTVVDQTAWDRRDMTSRVWDPISLCTPHHWQRPAIHKDNDECIGFGFNRRLIYSRNYIVDDSMLIKLDVYIP